MINDGVCEKLRLEGLKARKCLTDLAHRRAFFDRGLADGKLTQADSDADASEGYRLRWRTHRADLAAKGPGRHLKELLEELGAAGDRTCGCDSYAAKMDRWGVQGCRDRRQSIVDWLAEQRAKASWLTWLSVGTKAIASGAVGSWMRPLDPLGSMVDEAIRRADEGERRLKAKELPVTVELTDMPVPVPPPPQPDPGAKLKWAVGVTTTEARRKDLLPLTLASLRKAGFEPSHLFVDGTQDGEGWAAEFDLNVTCRWPSVKVAVHWVLSLYELYARDPLADRYAMFQDDVLCSANLRAYLEASPWPGKAYLNLFTFWSNESVVAGRQGWMESGANSAGRQTGRGALALVFDRAAVVALLSSKTLTERPQAIAPANQGRGLHAIDGGIVHCLNEVGYRERIHSPSLVQHLGRESTVLDYGKGGKTLRKWGEVWQAQTWRGEGFDCLSLINP